MTLGPIKLSLFQFKYYDYIVMYNGILNTILKSTIIGYALTQSYNLNII